MAACTGQLAENRTRPASRGTCRATAVKPRPIRMSPYAPARMARRNGCRALALLLEDPFALEVVAEEEKKEIDGNLGDVVAPAEPEVQGAG